MSTHPSTRVWDKFTVGDGYCPNGHEYTEENTRVYRGSRYCRMCRRRPWRKA